jgi:hypothetical protein
MLPFEAESMAELAATLAETAEPVAVIAKVYTVELIAVNVPAVALVSATSEAVNPVTPSEKVNVKVMAELLVGPDAGDEVIARVGATESKVLESCIAAVLLLPALSWATLAATLTVTAPWADGVTFTV